MLPWSNVKAIDTTVARPFQRARLAPTARVTLRQATPKAELERPRSQPPVDLTADPKRHAIGPELLSKALDPAQRAIAELLAEPKAPANRAELADAYVKLAQAVSRAEAALLGSLDGLDARVAPKLYGPLRDRAFAALREAGRAFAKLDPSWSSLVHGKGGWASQPVVLKPDRGDGVPLRAYANTYKKPAALSVEQQKAEYDQRVETFTGKGGRFEDIITAKAGTLEALEPMFRYDYVLEQGGPLRLFPNGDDSDDGPPKPGHSLLAVGGEAFRDTLAALAGELWVLKDSQGDLEAVVVANNSGHFKPVFDDLPNVVPVLKALGVPEEKIVLFGGPNNLPAMFRELEQKFPDELAGVSARLPGSASELLDAMRAETHGAVKDVWS